MSVFPSDKSAPGVRARQSSSCAELWQAAAELEAAIRDIQRSSDGGVKQASKPVSAPAASTPQLVLQSKQERLDKSIAKGRLRLCSINAAMQAGVLPRRAAAVRAYMAAERILGSVEQRLQAVCSFSSAPGKRDAQAALRLLEQDVELTGDAVSTLLAAAPDTLRMKDWEEVLEQLLSTVESDIAAASGRKIRAASR